MGSNFYILKRCDTCSHTDEKHIGKATAGWKFIFQAEEYKTKAEWYQALEDDKDHIFDEHGHKQDLQEFIKFIESQKDGRGGSYHGLRNEYCQDEFRFYDGDFV